MWEDRKFWTREVRMLLSNLSAFDGPDLHTEKGSKLYVFIT